MSKTGKSLLCRIGVHQWTADADQGSDELEPSWACYCLSCHIERFDEQWQPATRADRLLEPIYRIKRRVADMTAQQQTRSQDRANATRQRIAILPPSPAALVRHTPDGNVLIVTADGQELKAKPDVLRPKNQRSKKPKWRST
jgi:hypothetical protein